MKREIDIIPDYMTTDDVKLGTKITGGPDVGVHVHDYYEVFYIINGSIGHVVNGRSETLSVGDMVFLRLFDVHTFVRDKNTVCSHRDIIIPVEQYQKCCNYINKDLLNFIHNSPVPPKAHVSLEELSALEQRFNEFINVPTDNVNTKGSIANILTVELLGKLIYQRKTLPLTNYPAWFEQLLSRFNMQSYVKLGLDEIIRPFNYNQSYICRVFKKYMGVTMSTYLCSIRLQYAAILLRTSDKTVIEIANDVGFSSVSFFNVQFKKQFNTTPKDYRKLSKKHA